MIWLLLFVQPHICLLSALPSHYLTLAESAVLTPPRFSAEYPHRLNHLPLFESAYSYSCCNFQDPIAFSMNLPESSRYFKHVHLIYALIYNSMLKFLILGLLVCFHAFQ